MLSAGLSGVAQTASAPAGPQDLSAQQREVTARLERLEAQMLRLARRLAEREPAKAERLREVLEQQGQTELLARLRAVAKLLADAQLGEADAAQQAALRDLATLLAILNDTANELDQAREARARVIELRKGVEKLYSEQLEHLGETRAAQARAAFAEQLREQAEALEELARRQAELAVEGARAAPPGEAEVQAQRQAAEQVQAVAERLKDAERSAPDNAAQRRTAEAQRAATAAQQAMQQAAERMEQAAGGEPDAAAAAQEHQEAAAASLRRAIARLRDEARRLADPQASRELEAQQRGLEAQAGQLEEQSRAPTPDGRKLPGGEPLQQARGNMQQSADRMGEQDLEKSEEEQQAALAELQAALEQLDDVLRQVREEEREETLSALEIRLKSVLQREEALRADLSGFAAATAPPDAAGSLALKNLGEDQAQIAEECRALRRLLLSEGTTVILPDLVGEVLQDMDSVAGALKQADAGPPVVQRVEDVIAALREIVGAVEQERKQTQQQRGEQQQQQQGGKQNPALLPPSTELKLLKQAQVRINESTAALGERTDAMQQTRFAELADRQQRLLRLTRQMHERD